MSQKKVDYYKEQKKNRKAIMKREKMRTRLTICITVLVLAALIVWFGVAVVGNAKATAEAKAEPVTTELDLTAIENYTSELNTKISEEKAAAETEAEEGEETVAASSAE